MRIGSHVFAGALFGATTVFVSISADARSQRHHTLRATHFARPDVSAPAANHGGPGGTQKRDDHGASDTGDSLNKGGRNSERLGRPGLIKTGTEGTLGGTENWRAFAKEATPPDPHMKDLGPVETRISVAPRLHGVKSDRLRRAKTKFKAVPGHGPQAHPKLPPATIVRNAIGVPIHPQGAENKGDQWKTPNPAGAGRTLKPLAVNGLTGVTRIGLRPQASNQLPANGGGSASRAITTMNYSNVGGSIMMRPNAMPGVIGGPAKNVVGILNGTTIHWPHQ